MRILPWTVLPMALAFADRVSAQTHFAPPPAPTSNPTTVDKAMLGKALFWDEQLSSSRTVACGTCHVPAAGGSDPRPQVAHPGADGVFGTADDQRGSPGIVRQNAVGDFVGDSGFAAHPQGGTRRAASVINAAYEPLLFRDGRGDGHFVDPLTGTVLAQDAALEAQATLSPVDPVQMAHDGRAWAAIAQDLPPLEPLRFADQIPVDLLAFVWCETYGSLFEQVFGSPGVTPTRIAQALAAYQRTLVADQSRFDRYLAGTDVLTAAEQRGLAVFDQHCSSCHSDLDSHAQPVSGQFRRTGVQPTAFDPGRFAVTNDPGDLGKFKVPGLRNVALRAPYMHDGSMATLDDVISFYNAGGGPGADPAVTAIAGQISTGQRADLIAFLRTLTDNRVANERPPFDRPRLWSESPRAPRVFGRATAGVGTPEPQMVAAMPGYVGTQKLTFGLDGVQPGLPHFFLIDFGRSPTALDVFGHEVWFANVQLRFFHLGNTLDTGGSGLAGYSSVRFEVPDHPTLRGLQLVGQWWVYDVQSPTLLASSRSMQVTLHR
ncbi:MAG: cytochrome-c peroxidase [Planctomycetota bacterium]